jgi:hypothetical protein
MTSESPPISKKVEALIPDFKVIEPIETGEDDFGSLTNDNQEPYILENNL